MKKTINTLGSTTLNHAEREELDFYQTPSYATKTLIENYEFNDWDVIWDPMAGNGAILKEFEKKHFQIYASDIVQRDYKLNKVQDYFSPNWRDGLYYDMTHYNKNQFAIVTNPPYECANEFLKYTFEKIIPSVCCVFLPVRYLEGQKRYDEIYYNYKPSKILMYVKRLGCYKQSDVEAGLVTERGVGSAVAYMWLIFEREKWGELETKTELDWIN
jgi:hypothetical protein